MSIESRLHQIASSSSVDHVSRVQYLIDEVLSSQSLPSLLSLFQSLLTSSEFSTQVSRTCMALFASGIKSLPEEVFVGLAERAVAAFRQHPLSFDEADFILREALFHYYISQEEFKTGAQYLAGVNFDSTTKTFTDDERADILVKCAEAFLEEDETIDADIFVNKASAFISATTHWSLQLRFKATFARVLDANRKFLEAATRYYDLSTTSYAGVHKGDLLELLGKSITCAVLGKSSAQRTRILTLLFKDDRISELESLPNFSAHASVLTKMYNCQLLREAELSVFESTLLPHQKAVSSDGFTILQRASIEHNIVAASKIYENISILELSSLIGLTTEKGEKVVARMISEDRLAGIIDQTEGFLYFDSSADSVLNQWDESIAVICDEVTGCLDLIESRGKL